MPGSVVNLRIVKERKDYAEAHITEVIKTDSTIVDGEIFCKHFFTQEGQKAKIGCGGCKWQMLSYANQLKLKEGIVSEAFEKIKRNDNKIQLLPIVASPQEKNYRNKIEFSFGKYITTNKTSKELEVLSDRSVGFHKQGEFSKIIDIDSCALISSKANQIFMYIKQLCLDSGLPVYDQKTHQ